jgi:hypothetical protein
MDGLKAVPFKSPSFSASREAVPYKARVFPQAVKPSPTKPEFIRKP